MKNALILNEFQGLTFNFKQRLIGLAMRIAKPVKRPHFYHAEAMQAQERVLKHRMEYEQLRCRRLF